MAFKVISGGLKKIEEEPALNQSKFKVVSGGLKEPITPKFAGRPLAEKVSSLVQDVGKKTLFAPSVLAPRKKQTSEALIKGFQEIMPLKEWEEFGKKELETVPTLREFISTQKALVKPMLLKRPTEEESKALLKTVSYPLRQISKPVEAIRAGLGEAIEKKPFKVVAKETIKGFLKPGEVKTLVSKVPFQEWEQGEAYKLIPRAVAEAIETVGLYHTTYGAALKNLKQSIRTSAQKEGIAKIERTLPSWEKQVKFPEGMSSKDKAITILKTAQTNRKVGDIVKEVLTQPTKVYGGGPSTKQLADLTKRFNLSQLQIKNIQKGIYTGLPAEVVKAVGKIKPILKKEVPKKTSVFEQPLNQAGYIMNLIYKSKPIPKDLLNVLGDMISEQRSQIGGSVFKPDTGDIERMLKLAEKGKLKINFDPEVFSKEAFEEFYPLPKYAKVKDYTKLQVGSGVEPMDKNAIPLEKGSIVRYKKGLAVLKDVFDDQTAQIKTTEGIEEIPHYELTVIKDPTKLTKPEKAAIESLKGKQLFPKLAPKEEIEELGGIKGLTPEEIRKDYLEQEVEQTGFTLSEQKELEGVMGSYKQELFKAIKEIGKVRPIQEEDMSLPVELTSKKGQPLDEIVSQLRDYGLHFESASELRQAILEYGKRPKPGKWTLDKVVNIQRSIKKGRAGIKGKPMLKAKPQFKFIGKPYTPINLEDIATQAQKALAHILATRKGLSPAQFKRLEKIFTGKTTMAMPKTEQEKIAWARRGIEPMTREEANDLIEALKGIKVKEGERPTLSESKALVVGTKASYSKLQRLQTYLDNAGLPFNDLKTLLRMKNIDPDFVTNETADRLMIELDKIRQIPQGMKITALQGEAQEFKNKDIEKKYSEVLQREANLRGGGFKGGERKIAKGEEWRSPFYQQMRLSVKQKLEDVRLALGDLEIKSGLPFYSKHYLGLSKAYDLKQTEMQSVLAKLKAGIEEHVSLKEQKNISDYFQAKYKRLPVPYLLPRQQKLADNIEEVMGIFKPFIKKYRFYQWLESFYAGENQRMGFTDIPNVTIQTLNEGRNILELQGEEALDKWLDTQKFGVVDIGYIPRAILGGKATIPHYKLGSFSYKALKPREAKIDLSNLPLVRRVERYLNNVLNLKYMEEPIRDLDDMLNKVSYGAHLPMDTLESIKNYTEVIKGYGKYQTAAISKLLRRLQKPFFRTITVKPYLWLRNLFQRGVTVQHKSAILDPRFQSTKLSPKDRDYYDKFVDQLEEMRRFYLLFLEEGQYAKSPIQKFNEMAEKVGSIYPLTDRSNRLSVFSKSLQYYRHYINLWKAGKINFEQVLSKTPYKIMRTYEQKELLKLLEENPDEASLWSAKWQSDNSQWLYKISERGLEEMTPNMRSFYNLFVWPKGLLQNLATNTWKASAKDTPFTERWAALSSLIGTIIAMELSQRAIDKITGAVKRSKYGGYNVINSIFWKFGGATLGNLNDMIDVLSDVAYYSVYGDEKEKARYLKEAVRKLDRVPMTFLPFYKPVLNVLEAMTDRQYISPLYNVMFKAPREVSRDFLQKIQHAVFGKVGFPREVKKKPTYKFLGRPSGQSRFRVISEPKFTGAPVKKRF